MPWRPAGLFSRTRVLHREREATTCRSAARWTLVARVGARPAPRVKRAVACAGDVHRRGRRAVLQLGAGGRHTVPGPARRATLPGESNAYHPQWPLKSTPARTQAALDGDGYRGERASELMPEDRITWRRDFLPSTSASGSGVTATRRRLLHTRLGPLPVSVIEGPFTAVGRRCWVAQLRSDDPRLDEVGDAVGMTEREALARLAVAVRRYGTRSTRRPRLRSVSWVA